MKIWNQDTDNFDKNNGQWMINFLSNKNSSNNYSLYYELLY